MVAEAALLEGKANLLVLQDKQDQLAVKRDAISVRQAGGKTQAVLALEESEKEGQALARAVALEQAGMAELEVDLERAEAALAAERDRLEAERERKERRKLRADLLAAEEAMLEARRRLEALPGRPSDRLGRRVATVLGKWLPPGVRPVVPEPPLATRDDG